MKKAHRSLNLAPIHFYTIAKPRAGTGAVAVRWSRLVPPSYPLQPGDDACRSCSVRHDVELGSLSRCNSIAGVCGNRKDIQLFSQSVHDDVSLMLTGPQRVTIA